MGEVSGRAGRYVQQSTGYRAFIPARLPPDPSVRLGGLQAALSRADRELGRLDGSVATLPNPDLFVLMYVRKEAVLSSQIEGTQSSLQDLLAAEAQVTGAAGPAKDVDEVVHYVAAMRYGLDRLSTLPVSTRLITEIHARLLDGVRGHHLTPGELRRSQNWIGPGGAPLSEATFVPPPPHVVPEALSDLERFLHRSDDLPLLVRVGIAHAQFETIHPFLDGNGRVGRLLITFLLCEHGVLDKPVLYLSHFFKLHRQEYYARLQAVRDDGAWEEWLAFFLRGVAEVSAEATDTARKVLALREDHRALITNEMKRGAGNGHRVLESLFERPIISVADAQAQLGLTFAGANNVIASLARIGILHEITGQARYRRFRYDAYVQLFSE